MRVAAIVLAAGASSRMGRPKALCEWRGRPFVWHLVHLAKPSCDPIVVVVGAHAVPDDLIEPATVVVNKDWEQGRLSSLQAGLRAAPGADAYLVLTVDRPRISPSTITALIAAAEPGGAILQPCEGKRPGHPIVYPSDVIPDLLALAPTATARDLYSKPEVAQRRGTVEVDDPAIYDNIDTPEDLAKL